MFAAGMLAFSCDVLNVASPGGHMESALDGTLTTALPGLGGREPVHCSSRASVSQGSWPELTWPGFCRSLMKPRYRLVGPGTLDQGDRHLVAVRLPAAPLLAVIGAGRRNTSRQSSLRPAPVGAVGKPAARGPSSRVGRVGGEVFPRTCRKRPAAALPEGREKPRCRVMKRGSSCLKGQDTTHWTGLPAYSRSALSCGTGHQAGIDAALRGVG